MKEFVNVARLVPMLQGRLSTKEVRPTAGVRVGAFRTVA